MHGLLKTTGILCVHLDYKSVHYIKVELDKLFGYGNPDKGSKHLVNEIIWCYGSGGASKKHFSKKHDTILVYSKTSNYNFNCDSVREPYKEKCKVKHKTINGIKYLRKNPLGRVPFDWFELPIITNTAKERIGYPTQKPIKLLNRFIKAFTNKNDIVADFFCGCGTTLSASQSLGRRWIGCDISKEASKVMRKRMARDHQLKIDILQLKSLTKLEILKLGHGEFEKYAVRSVGGTPTPNSKPVDGYMLDGSPIEVKMTDKVGVGVLDKFHRFLQKNGRGYIVAKSFGRGFKDEVARLKLEEGLDVVFMTIDDIIRDAS